MELTLGFPEPQYSFHPRVLLAHIPTDSVPVYQQGTAFGPPHSAPAHSRAVFSSTILSTPILLPFMPSPTAICHADPIVGSSKDIGVCGGGYR
eukprot:COSAG02_NODE_8636_length_2497_cov_2.251043_1_plen_93_part_00